jgi:RNA-directed DNA polymerase
VSARMRARSTAKADGLDKVRALQRVLDRSAKQQPHRRFHALFDKVARSDILGRAWDEVRGNRGAPGVDGVTIQHVEASGVVSFLHDLAAELTAGTYRPAPLRRVHIPKPGQPGKTRPLSIPTVRDRVAMTAAKLVLEPIFEADFLPASHGFRPKRSAHQACDAVRVEANRGAEWVLDADVRDCFGSIDHNALRAQLARRVRDRRMLKLLGAWLRVGVLEDGVTTETGAGTPQGSPISPLLANIALHVLDQAWARGGRSLGVLVRYCDDFVILCRTRQQAEQARRQVAEILVTLGLHLHPDKTRIVELTKGRQGFDFLGFHHRKVASWRRRGRYYLQRWPATRAMNAIRAKIREATIGGMWATPLRGSSATSTACCAAGARTSATATPRGSSPTSTAMSTNAWPSSRAPSTASGTTATGPAGSPGPGCGGWGCISSADECEAELRCACAAVNDVGKPCAGELHARFDRGPLADQARVSRIEHRRGNPTD